MSAFDEYFVPYRIYGDINKGLPTYETNVKLSIPYSTTFENPKSAILA